MAVCVANMISAHARNFSSERLLSCEACRLKVQPGFSGKRRRHQTFWVTDPHAREREKERERESARTVPRTPSKAKQRESESDSEVTWSPSGPDSCKLSVVNQQLRGASAAKSRNKKPQKQSPGVEVAKALATAATMLGPRSSAVCSLGGAVWNFRVEGLRNRGFEMYEDLPIQVLLNSRATFARILSSTSSPLCRFCGRLESN